MVVASVVVVIVKVERLVMVELAYFAFHFVKSYF